MTVRIVRLGSSRPRGETTRIGTVRRSPRGVPKSESVRRFHVEMRQLDPSRIRELLLERRVEVLDG